MDVKIQEYRPELLSRRGEIISWSLGLVVTAAWILLRVYGQKVIWLMPLLAIFLLLSGASISLGNWVDRHTVIKIDPDRVIFDNGLRHTDLAWGEIQKVQVTAAGWGKKVSVIGLNSHFEFRTLGEVKVSGEVKGRMGFSAGDGILSHILQSGNLQSVEHVGSTDTYQRR
jgi:hypothetical protein